MIRKSELEKRIFVLQTEAQKLGLIISECKILNENIIAELEKVEHRRFFGLLKTKPVFVSKKNYNNRVTGDFKDNEYGRIYGISLIKM
jgi:hypothetical protein